MLASMSMAARWGSCLTGCYIEPSLRHLRGAEGEPTVFALLLDVSRNDAAEAAAFHELAQRYGVAAAGWVSARSGMARTLRQLGAWHDLIVIEREIAEGNGSLDVLGEAMISCRKPCLVLPRRWSDPVHAKRVMLAWNGSIEAMHAIHGALPFLVTATEVWLLDGTSGDEAEDADTMPAFDPVRYLAHHGVGVRRRSFQVDAHEAGTALLHEAERMHVDLLVMGAYGRSRMRERGLGGATRHVLGHAQLPVLMQH